MNSGDIAWVLVSTALVVVMVPALGFFYGGLVRRKNMVSTMIQCVAVFAVVTLVWTLWGYSEAFAPTLGGVIGGLGKAGLNGVGLAANAVYSTSIPELLFVAFQGSVAALTPALIIGAFAERVSFKALLLFVALWVTLIYAPVAHWVWGDGGWLRALGVVDFAGGLVVHLSAGVSAVAAALVIGKRKGLGQGLDSRPSNVPYVILGAAVLWFGWFGFNAGSALGANDIAVQALVNTNLGAAAAAVSWMLLDWARRGKPSAVGISVAAVCGLVAVTPAAGYVGVLPALFIGLVIGVLSNLVSGWRASRNLFDDSLDVFAAHGVGGMWGVIATGIFASTAVNAAGPNGALYGDPYQLALQAFAVVVVGAFVFVGSYALLKVVDRITPLRVTEEEEELGLDRSLHGEEAYN